MKGTFKSGRVALARKKVKGRIRVPSPAAKIRAFIASFLQKIAKEAKKKGDKEIEREEGIFFIS
jgi:hypothetical protein